MLGGKGKTGFGPPFFFLRCYPGLVPGSVSRFVEMMVILFILLKMTKIFNE